VIEAVEDTWYMVGRQARNLFREPIWIVLMLVQPMVWLLLYGQLFKRLPSGLPGFGTTSYIEFLAPGIVVMNAFFGGSWSGMAMVTDLDRGVIERFLATPVSRASLVLSQLVRAGMTAAIQTLILLVIALALGARVHAGPAGWLVVLVASPSSLRRSRASRRGSPYSFGARRR
jgi:ABC-2 type transport system permease protein